MQTLTITTSRNIPVLVNWINELYGGALALEFTRRNIPFFNQDRFDLFYVGYGCFELPYFYSLITGDSFPTIAFGSSGITMEQVNTDVLRYFENFRVEMHPILKKFQISF